VRVQAASHRVFVAVSAWEIYRYRFLQPVAEIALAVWLLVRTAEPIMRFTNG
jgi:hypothetical protein